MGVVELRVLGLGVTKVRGGAPSALGRPIKSRSDSQDFGMPSPFRLRSSISGDATLCGFIVMTLTR